MMGVFTSIYLLDSRSEEFQFLDRRGLNIATKQRCCRLGCRDKASDLKLLLSFQVVMVRMNFVFSVKHLSTPLWVQIQYWTNRELFEWHCLLVNGQRHYYVVSLKKSLIVYGIDPNHT